MNLFWRESPQRLIYIKILKHKKFKKSEFDTNWLAKEKILLNTKAIY